MLGWSEIVTPLGMLGIVNNQKRIRAGQSDPPCCRLWIWTVNPCTLFTSVLDYGSIFVISGGDVLRKTEEIRPLM